MMVTRKAIYGSLLLGVAAVPAVLADNAVAEENAEASAPIAPATGPATNRRDRSGEEVQLGETVVTSATRTETPFSEITRSLTLIDRRQIEQQSVISRDLGDILGKTVPGLATSTEGLTNFTQNLRGRKFLTLVDGVPISTPLRDGARDLKVIDPEAVERVEVIRGGTAVYGFGATGGLVNFITREPQRDGIRGYSKGGFGFSTEHPDDSLRLHTAHGASGQLGPFDFVVNASVARRNSFFDADGDRIPPNPLNGQGGLADTSAWNVLGKFGLDLDGGRQRIEVMVNNYDINQSTDFVLQPGDISAGQKTRAVRGDPPLEDNTTQNELVNVNYEHRDVLGSRVKLQAYHLDYFARFPAPAGFAGQSELASERIGTRLTIDTPVLPETLDADLTWGLDYMNERTAQPATGFGDVPEMDQDALAGFAELSVPVADLGRVRAGLRHEAFWIDVPTFSNAQTLRGGELTFDETLLNINGVAYLTDRVDLFGGFSQGYSPNEIGRKLRTVTSAATPNRRSVEQLSTDPQKVDNYELGLRGDFDWLEGVQGEVVGFYSESDNATGFTSGTLNVADRNEEIWGVESSLEMKLHRQWKIGGTATWLDGQADTDRDGELDDDLENTRIPPVKLTGFVEYQPFDWWRNRLQALYSGSRDQADVPAPGGGQLFGNGEVDSFVILDLRSSFDVGPGSLRVGVENLLNEDYFSVAAQAFNRDDTFSQGQGRSMTVSYRVEW
jgi:iron complex outermembrane receptor protein